MFSLLLVLALIASSSAATNVNVTFRSYVQVDGITSDLSDALSNTAPPGTDVQDNALITDPNVQQFIENSEYKTSLSRFLPCSFGSVVKGDPKACERQLALDQKQPTTSRMIATLSLVARDLLDAAVVATPHRRRLASSNFQELNNVSLVARDLLDAAVVATPHRRRLASSNFQELNNVLRGLVLGIADQSISKKIWPSTLVITLSSLRCGGMSLHDFTVNSKKKTTASVLAAIKLTGLSMACSMNYRYEWGWFSGSGSLSVDGDSSSIATSVLFMSKPGTTLATSPPSSSEIVGCAASIDLDNLQMRGGIVSSIASLFKGLIKSKVVEALNPIVCEQFEEMGVSMLSTAMNDLASKINHYLPDGKYHQTHQDDIQTSLELENKLTKNEKKKLISFRPHSNEQGKSTQSNPNTFVSNVIQNGLDTIDQMLGSEFKSNKANALQETKDLGINNIVRTMFPASTTKTTSTPAGVVHLHLADFGLDLPLYDESDPLTHTTLSATNITVSGLDSFTTFKPMELLGDHTFNHEVALKNLEITMHLSLAIKPTTNKFDGITSIVAKHDNKQVNEIVTLSMSATRLFFSAASFWGISAQDFFQLKLGSVFNNPLPCTSSAIARAELTSAIASIGDITEPMLTGFLSSGLDQLFGQLVHALFLMFEDTITMALPSFVSSTGRPKLNKLLKTHLDEVRQNEIHDLEDHITGSHQCSPPDVLPNTQVYLNFLTSPFWKELNQLLSYLDATTVNGLINNVTEKGGLVVPISTMTNMVFGEAATTVEEAQPVVQGTLDMHKEFGRISIRTSDIRIENLDTVHDLMLLSPNATYELNNSFAIGTHTRPLSSSINVFIGTEGGKLTMHNNFTITAGISELELFAKIKAQLDLGKINHLEMQSLPSIDCWVSTLEEFGLPQVAMSIGKMFAHVRCLKCTSPGIEELSQTLGTTQAQEELTNGVNKLFDFTTTVLQSDNTSQRINEWVKGSSARCYNWVHNTTTAENLQQGSGRSKEQATYAQGVELDWMVIGTALVSVLGLAGLCMCCKRKREHQQKLIHYQKSIDKQKRIDTLAHGKSTQHKRQQSEMSPLISSSQGLWKSPVVPLCARVLIPVLLLVNAGFFFSGHVSLGAQVKIVAEIAGEKIEIPDFFTFSLAQSTLDMWQAGARALAIVIVVFSGLWPYSKIVTSLLLWFVPPTTFAPAARGSCFMWLDALGKWSMIDIFVLVLSMIGFHLKILSPALAMLPKEFYVVEIQVVPRWGLYSNLIAQVLSQIISHFIIYYHRNVVSAAETSSGCKLLSAKIPKLMPNNDQPKLDVQPRRRASTWINATENIVGPRKILIAHKEALRHHVYDVDRDTEPMRVQISPFGQWFVTLLLLLGPAALLFGASNSSFSMETSGLAGLAIEIGNEGGSVTQFSLFGVFTELYLQADVADYSSLIGVRSIALLFLVCAICVPLLQLFFLLVLWMCPLTLKQQKRVYIINEALSAWQYLEVYLIAVAVGTLQISQIAGFMIGDACDGFKGTFDLLADLGVIEERYKSCFNLEARVEEGTWQLLVAAVVLNFLVQLVSRACAAAMEDRENRIRGESVVTRCDSKNNKKKVWGRTIFMMCCCMRYVREEDDEDENKNDDGNDNNTGSDVENPLGRARTGSRARGAVHTPPPQSNGMPAHWTIIHTDQGGVYYWNSVTGVTTWQKPKAPLPLALNWEAVIAEEGGHVYYWNSTTQKTQWERPVVQLVAVRRAPPPPPRKKCNRAFISDTKLHQYTTEQQQQQQCPVGELEAIREHSELNRAAPTY